jgi:hypothetical protein
LPRRRRLFARAWRRRRRLGTSRTSRTRWRAGMTDLSRVRLIALLLQIQLSNSPASPSGVRRARPARLMQTRVIAPHSSPARGSPVFHVPHLPKGACGTTGRFTAPAAPAWFGCGHPACRLRGTRAVVQLQRRGALKPNRASEADPRLRSAREWTLRLAACPRGVTYADVTPFERAVARTCTWTVRPACRRLSPSARFKGVFHPHASSRAGIVAAIRTPLPRNEERSRRAPWWSGMGGTIIVLARKARTKKEQSPTIFSENQK